MLMDIGQRKGISRALLGVKADRNPLDQTDIVYRGFLIEIGQRNVPIGLVNIDGSNGRRYLLHQSQLIVPIDLIGLIDIFL